jgi:tetratricopeptide (TPR) repeat protein
MSAYQEALQVIEPVVQGPSAQRSDRSHLAHILNDLGNLQVEAGRLHEAEATHRRALEIRRALSADDPNSAPARLELSLSYHNLGWIDAKLGRPDSAVGLYRKARELIESIVQEWPKEVGYHRHLARTCNNLSRMLSDAGRKVEAREPLERTLALLEPLVRDNPGDISYRAELASAHFELGWLENAIEIIAQKGAGLAHHERALALREALVHDAPTVAAYRKDLADSLLLVGRLHADARRFPRAEPLLRRAVDVCEGLVRGQPDAYDYRECLARTLTQLGLLLSDTGRPAEALPHHSRAIDVQEGLLHENPDSPELMSLLAGWYNNRGLALAKLDRHPEARADYRKAIELERTCLERVPQIAQHRDWLSRHFRNLGKSFRATGQLAEALAAALEAYRLRPDRPDSMYEYACDFSVLSSLVGKGQATLSEAQRARRDDWADQAVRELRRAIERGFHDVRHINADPDWDSLRSRADFRALITDLIFSVDPFAH